MRHIITIIKKQIKDTLRNKAVLIQFVMFPALAVIMTRSMQIEGMPQADVSSWQYLVGVGSYVFFFCMLGAGVFCLLGGYTLGQGGVFLLIMAVGILTSLLLGAAVGIGSGSQMAATSVTVPVMLLFSFSPMLSMFNDHIAKLARFTYTEQIRLLLNGLGKGERTGEGILIIAANIFLFGSIFWLLYRRQGFKQNQPALTKN